MRRRAACDDKHGHTCKHLRSHKHTPAEVAPVKVIHDPNTLPVQTKQDATTLRRKIKETSRRNNPCVNDGVQVLKNNVSALCRTHHGLHAMAHHGIGENVPLV